MEYEIQLHDMMPKMQYLREHIKTLLRDGVVEPSLSNYLSPLF